jgi:hypothetical protein
VAVELGDEPLGELPRMRRLPGEVILLQGIA